MPSRRALSSSPGVGMHDASLCLSITMTRSFESYALSVTGGCGTMAVTAEALRPEAAGPGGAAPRAGGAVADGAGAAADGA